MLELKCGCSISKPNQSGYTIPYFCDSEIENDKGEYFYVGGRIANDLYFKAWNNGKCLSKTWREMDYKYVNFKSTWEKIEGKSNAS